MASRRVPGRLGRLAQLWQLPLLILSLGLFAYAAYVFIDPRHVATVPQRLDVAEAYAKNDRFEYALELCNKLLANERMKSEDEARLHILVAKILDGAQKEHHISLATNHERIVEQTQLGLVEGAKANSEIYRRLGESQEALGHPTEALDAYRRAMAMDSGRSLPLQRKVIELQLAQADPSPAEASIEEYLQNARISDAERGWALSKKAEALVKREKYLDAEVVLDQALKLDSEPTSQGVAHYWMGYCTLKLGDDKEAERILRFARNELKVAHPLDAEAALLLGDILLARNDAKEAASFYQDVLTSHPESRPAPIARLKRGLCRIQLDDDPAGLADLRAVVKELGARKNGDSYKAEATADLKQASSALAAKGDLQGALEVMEDEQSLVPEPPIGFFARLAGIYARRADQVERTIADAADAPDRLKREEQVRKLRTMAGDAYIAFSRGLTLADDRGQGEAMWKGVDLYDRCGAIPQAIAAMELFVLERPDDGVTPDALLRLGRAYQATGQFDKAIAKFQQNQFRYPQSLAASRSGVPLAQAYIAKGPQAYPKAEKTLLAVLENNPILTPDAEEFRQALFELAQLYYRTGRYEEAISRLEETTERYPNDAKTAQLLFLMADSYRKSAGLLTAAMQEGLPTTRPATPDQAQIASAAIPSASAADQVASAAARAEAAAARRDRLIKAKQLFTRVVDLGRQSPPNDDMDKLHLKLSHFYRADCLYDLGEYDEAIRVYDAATLRYQDDPSAVAAYVQIVNAYCALGKLDEARTANERAKWLLRRMPAEAFQDGRYSMPKKYWDDWLRYTSESGMYAKDLKKPALSDAR